MKSAKSLLRPKSKYRTVCFVKGYTSRFDLGLDVVLRNFPTLKRFLSQVNGPGNSPKIYPSLSLENASKNIKSVTSCTRIYYWD